jgi:N-acyl homoserine lactone hydrolase
MMRSFVLGAALSVAIGALATNALAESPAGMKLYVFSSGALTIGKGVLQNFGPMEPPIQIPVGFFVIKHPKGNVLFDTGNNDKIITDRATGGLFSRTSNRSIRPTWRLTCSCKKSA